MQTFKHRSISNYYFLSSKESCEYLSLNFINFCPFPMLKEISDEWEQCPESEYIRVREQTMHFLNEMRPKVTGASLYLNQTVIPQTAE